MKKIISSILVVMMIVAFAAPAFADPGDVDTNGGGSNLTLNGTVAATATLVSVTLPTSISFAITLDASKFGSLTSGTGTMTNNLTTASAYVYLNSVSETFTGNTIGLLSGANAAQLDIALGGIKLAPGTVAASSTSLLANLAPSGTATLEVTGAKATGNDGSEVLADGMTSTIVTVLKVFATAQPAA